MLLLVQNNPQSRKVNRSHGRSRDVPSVWIAPVQEKWPYQGLLGMHVYLVHGIYLHPEHTPHG
jgi:hypothetical protein